MIGVPSARRRRGRCSPAGPARRRAAAGSPAPTTARPRRPPACRTRRALQERPEAERDQQRLHPAVVGQGEDGALDDLERPGLDGQRVEEDGVEDDPADRQQAEGGPVPGRGEHGAGPPRPAGSGGVTDLGRREGEDGDQERRGQPGEGRDPARTPGRWPAGRGAPPRAPPRPAAREGRNRAGRKLVSRAFHILISRADHQCRLEPMQHRRVE